MESLILNVRGFCIFHCIFNSIAYLLNMKESLQIVQIGKKEIKQIVGITPLAKKHRQLIRVFCFISDRPKMIIT